MEYIVVRMSDMSGVFAFTVTAESVEQVVEWYNLEGESYHIQSIDNTERVTHILGELSYLNTDNRTEA
jgi:hypothetical protein